MSQITQCQRCGGNLVTPAYEGDGAYPVGRMCECGSFRNSEGGRARPDLADAMDSMFARINSRRAARAQAPQENPKS